MKEPSDSFPARCLITGGARGIGLAVASAMLEVGGRVAVCDLDTNEDTTSALGEPSEIWQPFRVHVGEEEQVVQCVEHAAKWLGGVDVLVNNAGVNNPQPTQQLSTADWQQIISINLTGAFLFCRESAPHMVTGSAIINVASIHAFVGSQLHGGAPYAASKAGLVGLTKALAVEWAPDIRVNAVAPTYIDTDLTRVRLEDDSYRNTVLDRQPIPRLAKLEEVANTVRFLASPSAGMITGSVVPVDGGWLSA